MTADSGDLGAAESGRSAVSIAETVESAGVIVCCGSGGVGKTTTAAVLGREAARAGRRAVVVTIDPAKRLADALGISGGLSSEPQRVSIGDAGDTAGVDGELWAMMLDTAATFDGLVRRHAEDAEQVERILSNGFYRNMAGAMSGTQEYMAAETLHALHNDGRFDLVVVDTPPSRNALDFLEAPGVLSRFLDHRVFRLAMLPTRGGLKFIGTAAQPVFRAIGRIIGSDVLTDALAFFQAFAGMETGFRERADEVIELLRADHTSFVVVASPRHDTIEEAVWFARQLMAQNVRVAAAIINRLHPDVASGVSIDDLRRASEARGEEFGALVDNLVELDAIRRAERDALTPLVELVEPSPVALVPLLDGDVHSHEGLDEIAAHVMDH